MIHCKNCLYHNKHPLNITFDEQGICSGCIVHREKYEIDWDLKLKKLKKIIEPYKNSKRSIHNCIVPVTGGNDSYYIVHLVKNILGMNPILVTYNNHYNTGLGIRNLSYLKTIFGLSHMTMTVQPQRIKEITKITLKYLGSIYWHCLAGQTVFPVQVACKFKIPLIFWGCHQGIDQVGMFSHNDEVEMTRKYRKEHDLMNFEAEDILSLDNGFKEKDFEQFFYPNDKEIEAIGVRGIYLNNFFKWDSKDQHEQMIKLYNYETRKMERTFDKYNNVACFHYSGLHDYIKFLKHGYGVATDHAVREIRLGRLNRNEAILLANHYTSKVPSDIDLFLEWLAISRKEFDLMLEKFINKNILEKIDNIWRVKKEFQLNINTIKEFNFQNLENILFFKENIRDKNIKEKNNYTLLGKGWVD
jgi:N-acetyl sugar amidotransferase